MQATGTNRNARGENRESRKGNRGKKWWVSVTALGPTATAGTVLNLTHTSLSSITKSVMGHGDLGDEMNLSLIHSFPCAKYSIIKVTYILYDLIFPDTFNSPGSHILLVVKGRKQAKNRFEFLVFSNIESRLLLEHRSQVLFLDHFSKKTYIYTHQSDSLP